MRLREMLNATSKIQYELRPGPRASENILPYTWLDEDRTGDYDPDSKLDPGIKPPAEIVSCRKRERDPNGDSDSFPKLKAPRIATWQTGRLEGRRMPVTLVFRSEKGQAFLKSLGSALDNWPEPAFLPPGGEIGWQSWWHPDFALPPEVKLRARGKGLEPARSDDDDTLVCEPTLGHPAARGCKPCFGLKQRCPLLDEGSQYPCDTYKEDGVECELVIEPAVKRSCENCNRARTICSYRMEGTDHRKACQSCQNKGFRCIAGPASGSTRTGP